MQTINVEPKIPISLNRIIEYILDNLGEEMPALVRECDHKISTELYSYTKEIIEELRVKDESANLLDEKATEIMETKDSKLLDNICEANITYLETGIHIGANLLWQLLDI